MNLWNMNLKKGKFKIVEGTRVRMVSSKDTHIVEGAYGTVVSPGIRESELLDVPYRMLILKCT